MQYTTTWSTPAAVNRRDSETRSFDLAFATAGLLLFSPVFLLAALAIWLEDGFPLLFLQQRLGRFGCPFEIYKFRSMRDGKVTRVGAWLRRSGIDEAAQFLNVLRGDMAMVGPRPLTAADSVRLGWDMPARAHRWKATPGITGLAQVLAGRSEKYSRRLEDLYLRRHNRGLDLALIAVSFAMNVLGKARVRAALARARRIRRRLP